MIDETAISSLPGRTVYGSDGDRIGTVQGVHLDATSRPGWMAVSTGWFGSHLSLVPVGAAEIRGDDVVVPYDKGFVKDAPHSASDHHLSPEEEGQLYAYYGTMYLPDKIAGLDQPTRPADRPRH